MGFRIERLKALRESRGWSQREFGRRCGFGPSLIGQYESGANDPSTTNLVIMADLLGVSADYLLGRSDDPMGQVSVPELSEEERGVVATFRREGWYGLARLGLDRLAGKRGE